MVQNGTVHGKIISWEKLKFRVLGKCFLAMVYVNENRYFLGKFFGTVCEVCGTNWYN